MRVLYLSEWYPHRYDAMAGLFVRKHAVAAAAQGAEVCVLYLHPDTTIRHRDIVDQTTNGVREVYVYYPDGYLDALRAGWQYVRRQWGMPDVCQLNVLTKNALLPLWLRWRYGIPYIIVEHWSGYLPQNGDYARSSWLHRRMAAMAVTHAECVLTVSEVLAQHMQRLGLRNPYYRTIHNVVDDFFFHRTHLPAKDGRLRLLHVSCFDERAKNVMGLLRAVRAAMQQRSDIMLTLVGTGRDYDAVQAYARQLQFPKDTLRWTGELVPEHVAAEFDSADALLLFSRFENAPVVISESMATGVPVIATAIGGIPEMVDGESGILVPVGDEQALTDAICQVADDRRFTPSGGEEYSMQRVGEALMAAYRSCQSRKR